MIETSTAKKGWFQRLTDGLSRSSRQMSEQVVASFVKSPSTPRSTRWRNS